MHHVFPVLLHGCDKSEHSMSEWAFRTLVAMTRGYKPIDMDRSRILCDLQEGKLLFCVSIAINTVSLYSRFAPFRKSRFAPQAQCPQIALRSLAKFYLLKLDQRRRKQINLPKIRTPAARWVTTTLEVSIRINWKLPNSIILCLNCH